MGNTKILTSSFTNNSWIGFIIIGFIINQFSDKLGWIGRLPGDIRLGSDNFRFYFPFTSLIILNLIIYFIIKIFHWLK